jgi:hypothetical protein
VKKFLDQLALIAANLTRAVYVMAVHNPRTTASGLLVALAFLGLDLDPLMQKRVAAGVILLLSIIAGDGYNRRRKK